MDTSRITWRVLALFAALSLAIAACGTNDGSGAVGGSAAAPSSDAGAGASGASAEPSAAANLSGELTVWAMGNEGTKLQVMADKFMAANPGVTVSVTPVDWGQAVAKLQTAIGGGETPDVSQMGTDMMGQFVETGALEPVGAGIDPSVFFESAWQTGVVDGQAYGVPWYVETRVLYYRTDVAEKAGITAAPTTWDELMTMAKAMQSQGGAEWGIALGTKNGQEYLPFVWSNGGDVLGEDGAFTLDSPQAVEALTYLRLVLRGGPDAEVGPGRLRHHAGLRGRHPPDVLLRAVAPRPHHGGRWRRHRGQVGDRPDAEEGDWNVLRGRQQPRRLQGQPEQGRSLGVRPVHGRPGEPGRLVRGGDRAAGRPERVGGSCPRRRCERGHRSGRSSRTRRPRRPSRPGTRSRPRSTTTSSGSRPEMWPPRTERKRWRTKPPRSARASSHGPAS